MTALPIKKEDFDEILSNLFEFWGVRHTDVRALHHPMFVFEFGDYGLVIKNEGKVAAYLLGFVIPNKQLGYIHFVGVHESMRKRGLATALYLQFFEQAKKLGATKIKAITTAKNIDSINFHRALGFSLLGEQNTDGVFVVKDYRGPLEDRVVFTREI